MSETTAHMALASFLRIAEARLSALAFVKHIPNEANGGSALVTTARGRVPIEALRNGQMGVKAGAWDWEFIGCNQQRIGDMGAYVFCGLAVELKSSRAYRGANQGLSPEQIAWRAHYSAHGWYTAVYPEQDWTDAARLLVRWVGGNVADFDFGGR